MIPSPFTALSLCTVVLSLQAVPIMADEWITATPRHVVSKNGQYLARIVPGELWGDTVGFAGSKKGAYARAEFYEKQPDRSFKLISDVSLLNPIAPVGLLLSNHGYLMTFDNWHNAGFGKVVSIYKPGGVPLRSYELEALYPAKRVEEIPQSTSSRHRLSQNYGFIPETDESKVYAYDFRGGLFIFSLSSGTFEYLERGQDELMERMRP